tara:strand:+ start:77 stop:949 length:873 start_codon:yes stop_codon:yes gene_type:complete
MGLGISALRSALEFSEKGFFDDKESVIDMGSQEIHIKKEDFIEITNSFNYAPNWDNFPCTYKDIWPGFPRDSSSNFWKMLKFKKVDCCDINNEHDSIYIDLNKPLEDKNLFMKYDLVTDFGNNEHPFNTAEAYRTMHRLCKEKGLIWINQALFGGNGFYNFDISFFESIAAVNKYDILSSYFTLDTKDGDQPRLPLSMGLLELLDRNKIQCLGVSYLFKKNFEKDFIMPVQNLGDLKSQCLYKASLIPETTHLGINQTRAYIPSKAEVGAKQAFSIILNKIKQKIFKKII